MDSKYNVCRTCLRTNLTPAHYVEIFSELVVNKIKVCDLIAHVMPTMELDVTSNVPVICYQCLLALQVSYNFKNQCLRTEEKLFTYMENENIMIGAKVHLNDIAKQVVTNYTFAQDDITTQGDFKNDFSSQTSPNLSSKQHFRPPCLPPSEKPIKPQKTSNSTRRMQTYEKVTRKMSGHKCSHCSFTTTTQRQLNSHILAKHKEKSEYTCEICRKVFSELHRLKLHLLTHPETGKKVTAAVSEENFPSMNFYVPL